MTTIRLKLYVASFFVLVTFLFFTDLLIRVGAI